MNEEHRWKKDRKNKTTFLEVASRVDVLRLVTRSSPRGEETRDKPKNVCVGGYSRSSSIHITREVAAMDSCFGLARVI